MHFIIFFCVFGVLSQEGQMWGLEESSEHFFTRSQ